MCNSVVNVDLFNNHLACNMQVRIDRSIDRCVSLWPNANGSKNDNVVNKDGKQTTNGGATTSGCPDPLVSLSQHDWFFFFPFFLFFIFAFDIFIFRHFWILQRTENYVFCLTDKKWGIDDEDDFVILSLPPLPIDQTEKQLLLPIVRIYTDGSNSTLE